MNKKMGKPSRRSVLKISVLLVVMFLIGIYTQQYMTYVYERDKLDNSISFLQKRLKQARMYENKPEQLSSNFEEIESHFTKLHTRLPTHLDVDGFKKSFSNLAGSFNVEVEYQQVKTQSHGMLHKAILSVALIGNGKAVDDLLVHQYNEPMARLCDAESLCVASKNRFHLELGIYSLESFKEKRRDMESERCPETEKGFWLWPFKSRIISIHDKIEALCKEVHGYSETLRAISQLEDKIGYMKSGLTMLKELTKSSSANTTESLAELHMNLGELNNALYDYQRLLAIKEDDFGKDHTEAAEVLEKMVLCFRRMGEIDKAEEIERRIKQIRSAHQ